MKKILILAIIAVLANTGFSQQQPLYSQYMLNGFLLNPAIAGSEEFTPVRITFRQQWFGINGAPSTQAISGHTKVNGNMGVGGYIFNDMFGPISRLGFLGAYSYQLPLESIDSKLNMGLSVSGSQIKVDQSNLVLFDEMDQVISGEIEKQFVPDANFGLYLFGDRYFAGISANQLIQYKINTGATPTGENKLVRHYYLTGGYLFVLNQDFDIEPSVMVRGTEKSPFQLDINVKAYWLKNYWLGVSYRTDKDLIAMLGLKYDIYYFGYAFDMPFSNLRNYTSGSHEVIIGINFGERSQRASSLL